MAKASRAPRRNGEGYGKLYRWVIDSEISLRARFLYGVLDDMSDSKTGSCYVRHSRLGQIMDCSPDSVRRAVGELASIGALTVTRQSGKANTYGLHPTPSTHAGTSNPLVTAPVPDQSPHPRDTSHRTGAHHKQTLLKQNPLEADLATDHEKKTSTEEATVDVDTLTRLQTKARQITDAKRPVNPERYYMKVLAGLVTDEERSPSGGRPREHTNVGVAALRDPNVCSHVWAELDDELICAGCRATRRRPSQEAS
jgi:hypothetical protein